MSECHPTPLLLTDRAQNFLAGFFGLSWSDYAKLLVIIDEPNFNNSLAAYFVCPVSLTTCVPVRRAGLT